MPDEVDLEAVAEALLAWYDDHRRDLAFRDVDDPYATMVAEVMLQQTQVSTVEGYFEGFLDRFPTVEALASADEDEVLDEWAGLGYYRRARHLHRAARRIVAAHDGRVPGDRDALEDLPGIGPYTAGAIASIAFDEPEPALDANAKRVLARLTGETGNVDRAAASRRLEAAARLMLQAGPPADLNQGLMELGSLVCRPTPRCSVCPLADRCRARRQGRQDEIPVTDDPPDRQEVPVALLAARSGDEVLLVKAPDDGMLAGTWGFPWTAVGPDESPIDAARRLAEDHGLDAEIVGPQGRFTYAFSHRTWEATVVAATADRVDVGRWVAVDDLDPDGLPGAHREVVDRLDEPVQSRL